MDLRLDPTTAAAECILELERLATRAGQGHGRDRRRGRRIARVDRHDSRARPFLARRSLPRPSRLRRVIRRDHGLRQEAAPTARHGVEHERRQHAMPTPMDPSASSAPSRPRHGRNGEPFMTMASGAGHDTMCSPTACRAPWSSCLARTASATTRPRRRDPRSRARRRGDVERDPPPSGHALACLRVRRFRGRQREPNNLAHRSLRRRHRRRPRFRRAGGARAGGPRRGVAPSTWTATPGSGSRGSRTRWTATSPATSAILARRAGL